MTGLALANPILAATLTVAMLWTVADGGAACAWVRRRALMLITRQGRAGRRTDA